jgi:hypothetical protein
MAYCTAHGSHTPASEIHMLERGGRKGAQSNSPGSWSASDARGWVRCGRRLMERSRSGIETSILKTP